MTLTLFVVVSTLAFSPPGDEVSAGPDFGGVMGQVPIGPPVRSPAQLNRAADGPDVGGAIGKPSALEDADSGGWIPISLDDRREPDLGGQICANGIDFGCNVPSTGRDGGSQIPKGPDLGGVGPQSPGIADLRAQGPDGGGQFAVVATAGLAVSLDGNPSAHRRVLVTTLEGDVVDQTLTDERGRFALFVPLGVPLLLEVGDTTVPLVPASELLVVLP